MIVAGFFDGITGFILDAINAVLSGLAAALNGLITAWPIPMPTLPSIPDGILTAAGWLRWSPIPIDAMAAYFAFVVSVWIAYLIARPFLRWLKIDD